MGIVLSRIVSDDNGTPLRTVRYGYTTHDGKEHIVGPVMLDTATDPLVDMASRATKLWSALVASDVADAIDIVRGNELVRRKKLGLQITQITRPYATNADIYPALLRWWYTAPTTEAQALVPAIDAVTDATLTSLIPGITAAQITAVRARAATLRPINDTLIADGGV